MAAMTDQEPVLGVVQPPAEPIRTQVLREAATLITGQRQEDYGPPKVNFNRIAIIWNILKPGTNFTPGDVALLMAGLKLARAAQGYTHDSAVDAAGYFALWAELSEEELKNDVS